MGGGSAITLESSVTLKARVLDGGEWSALTEATFFTTTAASAANLRITEIYYNPPGPSEGGEFLELRNVSSEFIHLDDVVLAGGITFAFAPGTVLGPGDYLLLVNDLAVFEAVHGAGLPVEGQYGGNLGNGGDDLFILNGEGAILQQITYSDDLPWSALADGGGASLVYVAGDPNDPQSWRPSSAAGGNPGTSDSLAFTGDPGGDDDGDGLSNYLQHALGSHAGTPTAILVGREGESYLRFRHHVVLSSDDVTLTPETSGDLLTWTPAAPGEFVLVAESEVSPGVVERTYERTAPGAPTPLFIRLRLAPRL